MRLPSGERERESDKCRPSVVRNEETKSIDRPAYVVCNGGLLPKEGEEEDGSSSYV